MNNMFEGCSNLESIVVSNEFKTEQLTNFYNMFKSAIKIKGGAGTLYNSLCIGNEYARIDDPDNGKPGYFTLKEN